MEIKDKYLLMIFNKKLSILLYQKIGILVLMFFIFFSCKFKSKNNKIVKDNIEIIFKNYKRTSIDTIIVKNFDLFINKIDTSNTSCNVLNKIKKENNNYLIKEWLNNVEKENVNWYQVSNNLNKERVLLGYSFNKSSTGLRANFYDAIIVNFKKNLFYEFITLSNNPNLIYFDDKSNLSFYKVDYSNEFLEKKDWNHVILEITKHELIYVLN